MTGRQNRVRVEPFMALIEDLIRKESTSQEGVKANDKMVVAKVADMLGFRGEAGMRKFYRFRRGLTETKNDEGKRLTKPADYLKRDVVEDALWEWQCLPLWFLYPEFEPKWCPGCRESVEAPSGYCGECGWRLWDRPVEPPKFAVAERRAA